MNFSFEELYKILALFEIKDKSEEISLLLNEFFEKLEIMKNENSVGYSEITKFEVLCQSFVKGIEFLKTQHLKDEVLILPIIHILNYHKYRNIPKIYLKALSTALKRYCDSVNEIEFLSNISNFFLKNIGLINLKEILIFANSMKLENSNLEFGLIEKINDSIELCIKNKDKTILTTILLLIESLKLEKKFEINELVKVSIELNCVDIIINIIKNNKEQSLEMLKLLDQEKHGKEMKQIIVKYKLDHNQFPILLNYQRIIFFKYMLKNFGIEKLEDRATNKKEDFECLLSFLKIRKFYKEAFSIFKRNETLFKIDFQKIIDNTTHLEYNENKLVEKNYFGPASLILDDKLEKNTFVHLTDLNYKEENVIWVNSTNLNSLVEDILSQNRIGIDCEFYVEDCTQFSNSKLATFQLATHQFVYIFDCIELINSFDFRKFFVNIMENEDIEKIGHTFKGDIKVFEDSFKIKIANPTNIINIENSCNLKNISLAHLTQHFMKKELCKYEQMSAWQKRPLRKSQLHYGALDAAILLRIHQLITQAEDTHLSQSAKNKTNIKMKTQKEKLNEVLKKLEEEKCDIKFLADDMIERLARKMRNCGFDTKYVKNCKRSELIQIAETENRLILTKSKEIYVCKSKAVIYKVKKHNTDDQLVEIINLFGRNLTKADLVKRCIICNLDQFILVNNEEVDKYFEKLEYKKPLDVEEFRVCFHCGQVYWEGNQYKKAKEQFAKLLIY